MLQSSRAFSVASLCIFLVACGGGGTGTAPSSVTTSVPDTARGAGSNSPGNSDTHTGNNTETVSSENQPQSTGDPTTRFTVDATARFNRPTDIAIDNAGNLYVMDSGNQVIRKLAASGTVSTLSGNYGTGSRLVVNPTGTLFVLDGPDIFKITPDGYKTTVASYPPGPGHYTPTRITVDAQDHLYVLLWYRTEYTIERYDPDNSHLSAYKISTQGTVYDFTSDIHGNLMVALNNGVVPGQTYLMSIPFAIQAPANQASSPANRTIQLTASEKLSFDLNGNLYIADVISTATTPSSGANPSFNVSAIQVRRLAADNSVTMLLNGFPDGTTTLRYATTTIFPAGVTADADANVYLSDQFDNAIYKISPSGQITLIAGKPGEAGSSD